MPLRGTFTEKRGSLKKMGHSTTVRPQHVGVDSKTKIINTRAVFLLRRMLLKKNRARS
jgi:hypothetical protein